MDHPGYSECSTGSGGRMRSSLRALLCGLGALMSVLTVPLGAAAPTAAADGGVIGGSPASTDTQPWVVALSSRERFGPERSGQFCGGAVVAPTTVITAAHCFSRGILGD